MQEESCTCAPVPTSALLIYVLFTKPILLRDLQNVSTESVLVEERDTLLRFPNQKANMSDKKIKYYISEVIFSYTSLKVIPLIFHGLKRGN